MQGRKTIELHLKGMIFNYVDATLSEPRPGYLTKEQALEHLAECDREGVFTFNGEKAKVHSFYYEDANNSYAQSLTLSQYRALEMPNTIQRRWEITEIEKVN